MGCTAISQYSENVLGKNESVLKESVSEIVRRLKRELEINGFSDIWRIEYNKKITFDEIHKYRQMRIQDMHKKTGILFKDNYANYFDDNFNIPDGGVIWISNKITAEKYPLLVSEFKTQGTNNLRVEKGKKKQAVGNAVERAGKYAKGMERLYEFDDVFPFVIFCCGCDFKNENGRPLDNESKTVLAKLVEINGLSRINTVYLRNDYLHMYRIRPFTLFAREEMYTLNEMNSYITQVVYDSFNYFINVITEKHGNIVP